MDILGAIIHEYGFNVFDSSSKSGVTLWQQNGVFCVNCVDFLDRTNVVQIMTCREVLMANLDAVILIQQ